MRSWRRFGLLAALSLTLSSVHSLDIFTEVSVPITLHGTEHWLTLPKGSSIGDQVDVFCDAQGISADLRSPLLAAVSQEVERVLGGAHVRGEQEARQAQQHVIQPLVQPTERDTVMDDEPPVPLPQGWLRPMDPYSGRYYYYHAESGRTTDRHPELPAAAPATASPAAGATCVGGLRVGILYYKVGASSSVTWREHATSCRKSVAHPATHAHNVAAIAHNVTALTKLCSPTSLHQLQFQV